ncbi:MAG: hypothetical protein LAT65_05380 [Saccharospirillum sp.]|nr:hypothetical protein [Saccharospirillum sp.]
MRFSKSLALPVLFTAYLLAQPLTVQADTEMRTVADVRRIGTDSQGNFEQKFERERLESPDSADVVADLLTSSLNLSGAIYTAGGPLGATALATQGYLISDVSVGGTLSQAFAGVLTDDFVGEVSASASARFEDEVIIDAPGLTGTQGTATFHYTHDAYAVLDGFIQHDDLPPTFNVPQLNIWVEMSVRVASHSGVFFLTHNLSPAGDSSTDTMPDEVVAESFTFTYGTPFTLRASLTASALLEADGLQLAQGRVSGGTPTGFQWLGITGLPANATVTGARDWSKAAPSPFTGEAPDPGPVVGPPSGGATSGGGTAGGSSGGSVSGWLAGAVIALIALRRRSKSTPSLPLGLSP